MPSSYVVGPHFEAVIQRLIASGRFANASEVVRAGLRLLEDHEREMDEARAELWAKIEEGMESARKGDVVPADEVFEELDRLMQEDRLPEAAERRSASPRRPGPTWRASSSSSDQLIRDPHPESAT